jgi:hypothetical protein
MKHYFTLILFFAFSITFLEAQNSTCANAIRICLNSPITYPASTGAGNAESGPDYGCLGSEPNPAWFTFQINTPGTHTILQSNSSENDLDFILYGPFSSETGNCGDLTAENTADCSYAGGATETIDFTSVNQGDFYILLVTNFSNQPTDVTFNQTSGTGTFDCNFTGPCQISQISVIPGICDSLTNTYSLQGSVFSFYPPSGGQLIVSSGGQSQTLNGPFNNTTNFSLSGLPSDGSGETITASFNISDGCTASANFTAPSGCLPCNASAISNGPVCEGGTLQLTTDYPGLADYSWTGPNNFTSNNANPSIQNVSETATGTYTVLIEGDNCLSQRSIEVEIIGSPDAVISSVSDSICDGDTLLLEAENIPGATWTWSGPLNFSSSSVNTEIPNAQIENSGWYYLYAERSGCVGLTDSVYYLVNSRPQITLTGDTLQAPGEAAVFYINGPSGMTYTWSYSGDETLIDLAVYTGNNDTLAVFWDDREGFLDILVSGYDSNGCASNQVTLAIHVTSSASVNNISNSDSFEFYPNPANSQLVILNKTQKSEICSMYSIEGKFITELGIAAGTSVIADLQHVEAGIYFLRFAGITKRFIITK